jgi:hypothetical protein
VHDHRRSFACRARVDFSYFLLKTKGWMQGRGKWWDRGGLWFLMLSGIKYAVGKKTQKPGQTNQKTDGIDN